MTPTGIQSFPEEVARELKFYVYRLIDPRNGETLYVGKGKGDRVFAHARAEEAFEGDELEEKLKRIREIRVAGLEVAHVVHRHGMDENTGIEVGSALIDAYPGLTNAAGGQGSPDCGAMHAEEIVRRYSAKPAVFLHRAMLITVNRTATETCLYEATRFAWKVKVSKARQAEVVLAVVRGLIVGAFVPEEWMEATSENFHGREDRPGRMGFRGQGAPSEVSAMYVGKRVPDIYRKKGAANPIKNTWDGQAGPHSHRDSLATRRGAARQLVETMDKCQDLRLTRGLAHRGGARPASVREKGRECAPRRAAWLEAVKRMEHSIPTGTDDRSRLVRIPTGRQDQLAEWPSP